MRNVRKSSFVWLAAIALAASGCSNGAGSPTTPASFEQSGSLAEVSAEKGKPRSSKDPSQYQLSIGGMVPGTFDNFFRSGSRSISKVIDCAVTPGAGGLPDCPATFPNSDDIISFLDTRFPGAGLAACFQNILAFNDLVVIRPSNPDPDSFEVIIEFTARTLVNGKTNNNAFYSYVGEISRAPGETDPWPPAQLGDQFDMMTNADDMVRLVPGHKRNGCPAGPVLTVQGATATVENLG